VGSNSKERHRAILHLLPVTRLGWWSAGLLTAFAAFLTALFSPVAAGERGGERFFSNLWLALPLLGAGVSGVLAGVTAGVAIVRRGERAVLVFVVLIVGLIVALFLLGEVASPH
jgi:uncharacterized membrane protein